MSHYLAMPSHSDLPTPVFVFQARIHSLHHGPLTESIFLCPSELAWPLVSVLLLEGDFFDLSLYRMNDWHVPQTAAMLQDFARIVGGIHHVVQVGYPLR